MPIFNFIARILEIIFNSIYVIIDGIIELFIFLITSLLKIKKNGKRNKLP